MKVMKVTMTYKETKFAIQKLKEDYMCSNTSLQSVVFNFEKHSFEDNLEEALIMAENSYLYLQDVFKLVAASGELSPLTEQAIRSLVDAFAVKGGGFHAARALLDKGKPKAILNKTATEINEGALAAQEMAFSMVFRDTEECKRSESSEQPRETPSLAMKECGCPK